MPKLVTLPSRIHNRYRMSPKARNLAPNVKKAEINEHLNFFLVRISVHDVLTDEHFGVLTLWGFFGS